MPQMYFHLIFHGPFKNMVAYFLAFFSLLFILKLGMSILAAQ